ncbi:uncharacterized protein N7459_005213 [Penicillium hispanicum]|uniref:uncharacterized protein n=1 Tax=Penicillium hispanicum TaxID=1080232 RepID=UPI00254043FE|nr:uncharacterized protein N7459_005213 [Penicillium hispanicum]KAJ5585413.1 hypothetical protein N7459_005213 [Penicillium hispanicum]
MVNVFRRLTGRARSSTSKSPDSGTTALDATSGPHALHRTASASSGKRSRRQDREAGEPVSRHLYLISDTPEFDPRIIHRFQAEAFDVEYIHFACTGDPERDRKALDNAVHEKEDDLETGERYAIVAYNRPAYYLLASHHLTTSNTNPFPRLCALIAYCPVTSAEQATADKTSQAQACCAPACSSTDSIFSPGPAATFLPIQIHLPGQKASSCAFWPWITLSTSEGDVTYKKRHRCYAYTYAEAQAGFAQHNLSAYRTKDTDPQYGNQISAQLAWSRTLGCLRRAFGVASNWAVVGNETVWDEYWQRLLADRDGAKNLDEATGSAMEFLRAFSQGDGERRSGRPDICDEEGSSVECRPTLAGGSDPQSLRSFFMHTFIPAGPDSQHIHLLSRTVGADRIVDEVMFSFLHTAEVPWLLPGVQPTNREIKVVIVVVASFCGGRIVSQNIHWDQADVLVQAGILAPTLVPKMKRTRSIEGSMVS